MNLSDWAGVPLPRRETLEGRYVRLEPLDAARHSSALYEASAAPGEEDRFRFMFESPMKRPEFDVWVEGAARSIDSHFFAVIDQSTGRAEGRQALLRTDVANGVIEIGSIVWGPRLARTRGATEAFLLLADAVFDQGYRRLEWKCNDLNEPSKRAASRFGFVAEGLFRQHMVVKGQTRDPAWYSILDSEWPDLRQAYIRWLQPENFDADAQQLSRLVVRPSSPR